MEEKKKPDELDEKDKKDAPKTEDTPPVADEPPKADSPPKADAPKEDAPPAPPEPPKTEDTPPEPPTPTEEAPPSEEVIMLRAQLAAVKSGMDAGVAEDAVYLAMRDAQKAGAADEAGIEKALKDVLKRHPEWGAKAKAAPQTGFKIGAESQEQKTGSNAIAEAFGNKEEK